MKVFAISDFHLCISGAKPMEIFGGGWKDYLSKIKQDWLSKISDNDVVLVSGDLSWAMKIDEAKKDFSFFEDLPGSKIFIRGNHDYWWKSISSVRQMLPISSFALQNDAVKIGNYIFCGTRGWTVPEKEFPSSEDKKIFDREVIRLNMALDYAKRLQTNNEEIICMIHYPPFNSLKAESEFVKLMKEYKVKSCVYGHIHGYGGKYLKKEKLFGINFYLTSCDILNNSLVEIE